MALTLAQICDAITNTLEAAVDVAHSYNELEESVPDRGTLQVYPEEGRQDAGGDTDRFTFGGGVRQTEHVIHADYYAQQRVDIGEDMAKLVTGIDAIEAVLNTQDGTKFGTDGVDSIKAFRWTWKRVTFEYGDPTLRYVGARFEIYVRTF